MLLPSSNQVEVEVPAKGAPHRWQKGTSGNIAGRPKYVLPDGTTVREAARAATPKALDLLLRVIGDERAAMPLRVAAATALLRTGHADSQPTDTGDAPKVFVIETRVPYEPQPVRGVLCSNVPEHIWREPESVIADACEVTQ